MGKILVLAEKPSVGRELARVLGCTQGRDGCIAGSKYIVTWALGHLVTLADPEFYGEKYKKWDLESLPMLPAKMETVVIRETGRQFNAVKNLIRSPETDELVIATDAGREGELVARWIIEKAGFKKKVQRLWISSQTDKAIREGFAKLRPAREYDNLYYSALCRAQADWLVGLNVTRALTCKYNVQLSAGRVQTPTLAMIVQRENEIRKFSPREFYSVSVSLGSFSLGWADKNGQRNTFDKQKAEEILKKTEGSEALITEVKKEKKREPAPLLYDLTELQRDANRRYGFTAKQTLNCMQKLYEVHKLLTYPRTDSRYLTSDIVPTLTERLKSIAIGGYAPFAKEIIKRGITPSRRFVDNARVSDHHAIIPTEQYVDLARVESDEKKIWDLVVKRFLAVLSPDFEYEQTSVTAEIAGEKYIASGKTVLSKGWKAVYEGMSDPEDETGESGETLPPLSKGKTLRVDKARLVSGKTKPPARYTEATLLSAMEHPGKFIENDELRAVMDSSNGIGTPATRADIIEKLFAANYVERRGKEIFPLSKGEQLVDLVPQDLKSPELTASWEQQLTAISKGAAKKDSFIAEMRGYASRLVSDVIAASATYHHDNMTKTRCPVCGKFLLEINGKKGKLLVCQDRDCGYKQNVSFLSNARCPNCHKKLEVYGEGEKKIYICKCGFREKADSFHKRMAENHSGVSKNEVRQFLKTQKEEPAGASAFAQAWAKAQEKN